MDNTYLKNIFLVFMFGFCLLNFRSFAQAATTNLVPNNGLEEISVDGGLPLDWQTDNWGNNQASFNYPSLGESGQGAIVQISSWQSGDAKWYFQPINVQPGTDYIFSDFYQANVTTRVVAMSLNSQGIPTYYDLSENVVASPDSWKKLTLNFKTISDSKTLTIFHLIDRVGYLRTDNFNLEVSQNVVTDYIPNNSIETPNPNNANLPESWITSSWGKNSPTYEYANEGHDGQRSLKLTMANYISGDAKFDYTPQVLTGGADYQFSAWYKTDTIPHVVVKYITNTNVEKYFGLPDPIPQGQDWQEYKGVFNVPKNTKNVSVFFFLTNNGYVQTDQYQIRAYKYQGFDRPIVTLTFDDGFEQNVNNALPTLAKYGFKTTYCYATMYVDGKPDQIANMVKITDSGHEACSHSVNHLDLRKEPIEMIDSELANSQNYIETYTNAPVTTFTTPYGAYDKNVLTEISKYYPAHRTTDEGFNSKDNLNPYKLYVQNMAQKTTLTQFKSWVNKAKRDKTWLILVYHAIVKAGDPLEEYDTKKTDFDNQMAFLSSSGVVVERLDSALAHVSRQ